MRVTVFVFVLLMFGDAVGQQNGTTPTLSNSAKALVINNNGFAQPVPELKAFAIHPVSDSARLRTVETPNVIAPYKIDSTRR